MKTAQGHDGRPDNKLRVFAGRGREPDKAGQTLQDSGSFGCVGQDWRLEKPARA